MTEADDIQPTLRVGNEPSEAPVRCAASGYVAQRWSAEQPAAAGWWWAERLSGERLVVELLRERAGRENKLLWVALSGDNHWPVDSAMFSGWRWAGPLPEPLEASDVEPPHSAKATNGFPESKLNSKEGK